jgi:hypothetical protein
LFYYCFAGVSLSPYWREPFLRSASLWQDVVLDRQVTASTNVLFLIFHSKLCN